MWRGSAVVGCGAAVGSLFAAALAQLDDVEVWAYDLDAGARRRDQRARPADHGRRRARRPSAARRPTRASCRPATSGSWRSRACTPIAAMADDRPRVRATARSARSRTAPATRSWSPEHVREVIRGTTFPAGHIVEPGHVGWDTKGDTHIGPFEPSPAPMEKVEALADACTRGGHADACARGRARRAVAQADLQRGLERDRRAHRPHARAHRRAAHARPGLGGHGRGPRRRRRAGDRAGHEPGGAVRLRGAQGGRVRPQAVDAAGRRGRARRPRSTS